MNLVVLADCYTLLVDGFYIDCAASRGIAWVRLFVEGYFLAFAEHVEA